MGARQVASCRAMPHCAPDWNSVFARSPGMFASKIWDQMNKGLSRSDFLNCLLEELPKATCKLKYGKPDNPKDSVLHNNWRQIGHAKECQELVKKGGQKHMMFMWANGAHFGTSSCFGYNECFQIGNGNIVGECRWSSTNSESHKWVSCEANEEITTTT